MFEGEGTEDALYTWHFGDKSYRTIPLTDPRPLGAHWPTWSATGRQIYFVAHAHAYDRKAQGLDSAFEGQQIWRTTPQGGASILVTRGFGIQETGYDIDWPNGKLLFIGLDDCLMESTLSGGEEAVAGLPRRVTATTEPHAYPRAYGKRGVLISTVPHGSSFWQVTLGSRRDAARLDRLTDDMLRAIGLSASPNGQLLTFFAWEGDRIGIWGPDLATRKRYRLSPPDSYDRANPSWYPDGSLVYWRIERSGRNLVKAALSPDHSRIVSETVLPDRVESAPPTSVQGCSVSLQRNESLSSIMVRKDGHEFVAATIPAALKGLIWFPAFDQVAFVRFRGPTGELWTASLKPATCVVTALRRAVVLPADYDLTEIQHGPRPDSLLLALHLRAGDVWLLTR